MAKKPLRRPDLPPGRRLDLFLFLQDQVLRNGDQSVASLAHEIGLSHQTIYKALTGPRVPSRAVIYDLATYLGRPDPGDLVDHILALWTHAVAEERQPSSSWKHSNLQQAASPMQELDLESFTERLQMLRNRAGVSIRDIATASQYSKSAISSYFTGRVLPSDLAMSRILDALGVSEREKAHWAETLDRARAARDRQPPDGRLPRDSS